MYDFTTYISSVIPLDTEALVDFDSKVKAANFKKGQAIVPKQSICKNLYFLNKGLVKFYFISNDGKEVIFRFFSEDSLFTSLESFLTQKTTSHILLTLEPTCIEFISKQDLDELCIKHHSFEKLYTHLLSLAATNMIRRFSEIMSEFSTDRYHNFASENCRLMQRISLRDLANYLGITQVSLSRIRAAR
ncbi:MAG: Crp/Fnr family transcriptional regulator [Daejeonella sp.]